VETSHIAALTSHAGVVILRLHLERTQPWSTLGKADALFEKIRSEHGSQHTGIATTEVRLALEAHRRFQRASTEQSN
jgi:hypothetical protein